MKRNITTPRTYGPRTWWNKYGAGGGSYPGGCPGPPGPFHRYATSYMIYLVPVTFCVIHPSRQNVNWWSYSSGVIRFNPAVIIWTESGTPTGKPIVECARYLQYLSSTVPHVSCSFNMLYGFLCFKLHTYLTLVYHIKFSSNDKGVNKIKGLIWKGSQSI